MAAPRVFLSSTYYDLKQVRNDIGGFIEGLGYQVVRHERSDVAYTQKQRLEDDCYSELALCDIVICVIGNSFGTQSDANELSITMNELERALKDRKIVYVYIDKSVYIENRTYRKNKDNPKFVPAEVNDVRIHKYIADLQDRMGSTRPIQSFESADEIIISLRAQFAGLFQTLLSRRVAESDAVNAHELHEEIEQLKHVVEASRIDHENFVNRFASTVLVRNPIVARIETCLGLVSCRLVLKDIWALDEAMIKFGYKVISENEKLSDDDFPEPLPVANRTYEMTTSNKRFTLEVSSEVFNSDGSFKQIMDRAARESLVQYCEEDVQDLNDIPF